jgi:hypothetical protein
VSEASNAELMRRKRGSDPVDLNSRPNRASERLLKINREKDKMKQSSGREADQAEAV